MVWRVEQPLTLQGRVPHPLRFSKLGKLGDGKLGDRRNVFSYCLRRLVLLIMIGDYRIGETPPLSPSPHVAITIVIALAHDLRSLYIPDMMLDTKALAAVRTRLGLSQEQMARLL